MKQLKLGILGMSEGNGHPYSWSAIFNGYDQKYMQQCPFPVIPQYLAQQKFPQDQLRGAIVTHIWTQDLKISRHIAKSTYIESIVEHSQDMIGQVDAVLLARDDAENHLVMAKPFLKAGLPIYIDKPLALDLKTARQLFSLETYPGQIFTCSALAFAKEFQLTASQRRQIGQLRYLDGIVVKSWDKYLIHILEPMMGLLGEAGAIKSYQVTGPTEAKTMTIDWENGLRVTLSTLGSSTVAPISIRVFGDHGWLNLEFKDTYFAFKKALATFIKVVQKKQPPLDQQKILAMIDIIEKGNLTHG